MKGKFPNDDTEQRKLKIRARYKGIDKNELEFIPARPQQKLFEGTGLKKVCAYCRVSTDDPKQTSSYELQKNHYTDMIKDHPGWELYGIFADEGISGTSLEHRENFKRMIDECKKGTIDLIVTKSVSRFARNIVDCIAIIRELANLPHPVGVLFEAEHIYTLDNTSEMILAVLSATAQEESRTKSEIMNLSIEQRFSRGIFLITELLGYQRGENGTLTIKEDEADIIRICFYLFLGGYSAKEIAEILTMLGCKRKHGSTQWAACNVYGILRNEKHCGDVLARKTFTPNYLSHKARKNKQDRNQYRQQHHHEGIVTREVFLAVQALMDSHKHMATCPLPMLKVIEQGYLKGYVPVPLCYTGFTYEDYLAASNSVTDAKATKSTANAIAYTNNGFQIVRKQMFSTYFSPAMRISVKSMAFTTSCMKKFGTQEYIEVLFHPALKRLAIRPCDKSTPGSVHWGRLKNGRWQVHSKAAVFSKILYPLMGWDIEKRYRICATSYCNTNELLLLFDLSEAELIPAKGKQPTATPADWTDSFGPIASNELQQQEHEKKLYANGRGSNMPAKTVSDLCPLTENDVNDYLSHAERIMEKVGTKNV